jgi:hypothetical protein
MAKVKNLLHQPLVLDFSKDEVVRFNAREVKTVKDGLLKTPVFKRNEKDLLILAEPQVVKEIVSDTKTKK